MAYESKTSNHGFPSHSIPPNKKGKDWCLKYLKAFYAEHTHGGGRILSTSYKDYGLWRQYAQGRQPIQQYKDWLSTRKNKGKNDLSWRNLDYNIFPVVPTLISVVKNKILGQPKDEIITAIDSTSQNEFRDRKNKMLTFITNQDIIQRANQMFGVPIESPFDQGTPIPVTEQETELHLQMYPKDRYIEELYDQIDRVKSINNWKQIWEEVVTDLLELGFGGTKSYIDITGMVRVRRVKPENFITNFFTNADLSDVCRRAEFLYLTVNELRSSVPRGTFTEEEYAKMAQAATGRRYDLTLNEEYYRKHWCYPYDNDRLTIMDGEWDSADDFAYVYEKSGVGNMNFNKQENPYWLDRVEWIDEKGVKRRGVTDDQYIEFNKKKGSERQIIRDSVNNLYVGKWIVGTEYVYDWGLMSNMTRSLNRLGDVRSNYNLYTFFDSFMRRAMPSADQIQLNWLQHQHHIAQSKPSGVKINKRALASVSVGGKGGVELDELEVLRMYAETGNLVYKGEDASGRPYPYDPIQELKGGVNEAAQQHLNFIIQHIDLLRQVFGLNQATDSSTPNPKLGKAIAEQLEQNTNTALGTVYHAYSHLFEETLKSIALLVPDAEMIKNASKDEGLGESSGQFFRANNDKSFREFAIRIEDGATNEVRMRLQKYIELSIQSGELRAEDAYLIESEQNIMRAYHLLALKRRQKMAEDQQMKQQLFEIENQKNIDSATATAEAKKQADLEVLEAEVQKEIMLHPLKKELISLEIVGKILVQKMENDGKLEQKDLDVYSRYIETLEKTDAQKEIARDNRNKPKPAKKSA